MSRPHADKRLSPVKDGRRNNGRPKGSPNKISRSIKEATLEGLERAGQELRRRGALTDEQFDQYSKVGMVNYFTWLALEHPQTFVPLVAKIIPYNIAVDQNSQLTIRVVREVVERAPEERSAILQLIQGGPNG